MNSDQYQHCVLRVLRMGLGLSCCAQRVFMHCSRFPGFRSRVQLPALCLASKGPMPYECPHHTKPEVPTIDRNVVVYAGTGGCRKWTSYN